MNNKKSISVNLVIQELDGDPYRKFKIAFSLMSVIPFLVFLYLLINRLFTFKILYSDVGLVLFIAVFISLCGFYVGYSIIKNILSKVISYAAQAKHSDQLKSTFVATASHELKNPISVIKMNVCNILDGLVGQVNPEQKSILEICQNVIDRMGRLVNELLDLHKIEAGMIETKRKLCNPSQILEKQIKELEVMINKKRITLIKEVSDKNLSIWADDGKITQIVNNLLSNAIKYTPETGTITFRLYLIDELLRIECLDTGPGIPVDKLDKIFDKFERLDDSKEGTGLGLAITKDIVEMHKGRIWAESKIGEGSKFIVVLPADLREGKR